MTHKCKWLFYGSKELKLKRRRLWHMKKRVPSAERTRFRFIIECKEAMAFTTARRLRLYLYLLFYLPARHLPAQVRLNLLFQFQL